MNSLKNDTWYIYSNNFEFVPQRAYLLLLFFCFFLFFVSNQLKKITFVLKKH